MQLEKLLQKNYFLHQSAKDGYRSYLQAYASYSLKKIFDVNQLDLAKVGKSFGFSIPPRVDVNIGGGKGGAGRSGKKRRREDVDEVWEEIDAVDKEGSDNEAGYDADTSVVKYARRTGKDRRKETLGKRKVEKEVYRRGMERKRMKGTAQWSR